MCNRPRVFVSAGEVSGDIVAARLIQEIRRASPATLIDGVGGLRMAQAGATVIASANHIGAIGVSEGLAVAPSAIGIYRTVLRHVQTHRPQVAVLIANDVFNVLLGRALRARGIPTIALFPPQTWIWQSLARFIAPSFDLVLAAFPDEVRCYQRAGAATEFVGHYLADVIPTATPDDRAAARRALGLPDTDPVVAILPGSRTQEVERLLPVLLDAADLIRARLPSAQFVAALTPTHAASSGGALSTPNGHRLQIATDSHTAMRAADVLMCCSGTATLEASLIGVPMVVAYAVSRTTYHIVRACLRTGLMAFDMVALPNLVLGRPVVPEFYQHRLTAPALADAALDLLMDQRRRDEMRRALLDVRAHIEGPRALESAARIVLGHINA